MVDRYVSLLFLIPALCFAGFVENPHRVLIVGNSMTFQNGGIDSCLNRIYAAKGKTFYCERATTPSTDLKYHFYDTTKIARIKNGNWDVVVFNGFSTEPIRRPSRDTFYLYARKLDSIVARAGAKTYFYMTFPWKDSSWALLDSLHLAYDSIGRKLGAPVIPAGLGYKNIEQSPDSMNMYADYKHPSPQGTYMISCMFYSFFTGESAEGVMYFLRGVTAQQAPVLQKYAWQTLVTHCGYGDSGTPLFINFNGNTASNSAQPWNNTAAAPSPGKTFGPFKDSSGAATSISITCGPKTVWGGVNSTGKLTGDNSGVYPDKVIEQNWWLENTNMETFKIGSLSPFRWYHFTFFGSCTDSTSPAADRTTLYTIGTNTVSLNATNNVKNTVTIDSIRCNSENIVYVTIQKSPASSRYGYLGAIVLGSGPIQKISANNQTPFSRPRLTDESVITFQNHAIIVQVAHTPLVSAKIFNATGRLVFQYLNERVSNSGEVTFAWPTTKLTPGAYLIQVKTGKNIFLKRVNFIY